MGHEVGWARANPKSNRLRIQIPTDFRRRWCRLPEKPGHDLVAVKAAILDEHLVRIVAGIHDASDEDTGHVGLERRWVMPGNPRRRIDGHANLSKQIDARCEPRHQEYMVRRNSRDGIIGRAEYDVFGPDFSNAAIPDCRDAAFGHAIREIRKHPRLDLLVERGPKCTSATRAPARQRSSAASAAELP